MGPADGLSQECPGCTQVWSAGFLEREAYVGRLRCCMSPMGLGRVKTPGGSIDAPRSRRGGHARSFFRLGGSFGLEVLLKRIPGVLSGSATADGRVSATTMPSLLP